MRICVIGSGIAGLTTAFQLCEQPGVEVTVYEQDDHFGGRADVGADGEHCPRFFMDDYHHLFAIMRQIKGADGGSVLDALRKVRRYAHTESGGWVEISHLYRILAKEIPAADKLRAMSSWRPSPLLAEQRTRSANRYGSLRNYSPLPLLRMAENLFRSKAGYVLPGPTDEYLIDPWVRHLSERGVTLLADRRVTRIEPDGGRVRVHAGHAAEDFDAVVVTAFVPDLVNLLNASRLDHGIREVDHTHCVAFTIDLDPGERILAQPRPVLFSRDGINVLVQPEANRCVVLCTMSPRTDEEYVLGRVRRYLGLQYEVVRTRSRTNQRPGEAILAGDYLKRDKILRRPVGNIYFAGSCVHNSYPLDSAEGAVRTALTAVRSLRRDLGPRAAGGERPGPREWAGRG